MKRAVVSAAILSGLLLIAGADAQAEDTNATSNAEITAAEAWAFPLDPPSASHAPKHDPRQLVHVPGSVRAYTWAQIDTDHFVPDWFPQDHPPAPQIVMVGRKPGWPWPCAECHLPNGQGDIISPSPAGLPKAYIIEQVMAFRRGERGASLPSTSQEMAKEARAVTDQDLQLAADYFSKLPYRSRTRVVETATVPKTHWQHYVLVPDKDGAREPIAHRIVETPADYEDHQLGDEHVENIAYVPPGSIARGAQIAAKGEGAAQACESCHGAKLQGIGVVPPLAGRSPTYIVRELILFRTGKRTNPQAAPMVQEASRLAVDDMIAVAAYAASRKP
ncbi:MAG: cytochrome C [Proteobacteria bacterium]|nr:cytochrome C [Pseudomonadota bacterium]